MQPDDEKIPDDEDIGEFDTDTPDEIDSTVVMSEDSFEESDVSMEVNVEKLVKEMDRSTVDDVARKKEVRRKLEELAEEQGFESTYAVEFDND